MTSYNNYRKKKIVETDDINKFISYLDKNEKDVNENFNSYFKNLFGFNINSYEKGHNFYQKFVELMYYSYNEIKKEKDEDYSVGDFYSNLYFIRKLIDKTFRVQRDYNYHYNFLIHIITDIIDIVKDEYKISKSVSRSNSRNSLRSSSRSNSSSYSISNSSSYSRSSLKRKSNWEKNKDYINFITQLLTILEEEAISKITTIETDIKLLLKLLYDFIIDKTNEDKKISLYDNNQRTVNISNTHIMICIEELNNMDNNTHLQLKKQLLENVSINKKQTRYTNKIRGETKTRRGETKKRRGINKKKRSKKNLLKNLEMMKKTRIGGKKTKHKRF